MKVALALLALILAIVSAQEFTCDVEYRTPLMRLGAVKGFFDYSWTKGKMKLTIGASATRPQTYTELYHFNGFKGLNGGVAPYLDQWVFRTGSSCTCETGHLDAGMPMLSPSILSRYPAAYTPGATSNGCTTYNRASAAVDPKVSVLSVGTTYPCYAKFDDGRTFTFSNCRAATFADSTFAQPNDCKCGKPLDIAIVLDRSSSISKIEFQDQKGFVRDFSAQFDFGPMKANMALVHFKSTAWYTLKLTEGVSRANIDTAINALGCPASCDELNGKCVPNDQTTCCCCCGTSISSGVRMGADQLSHGRAFAPKLIIVITDGYHNTLFKLPGPGPECGSDDAACTQDLLDANNYAFKLLGRDKLAIYAVGVGSDRDISLKELTLVADGHSQRVLRRKDFSDLAKNNLELVARTCDENTLPCGGACCGFCVCGACLPPDVCDSSSPCIPSKVQNSSVCCAPQPVTCIDQRKSDPCHTYKCDDVKGSPTAGTCIVNASMDCGIPENSTCYKRECNASIGTCQAISICRVPPPECTTDRACNDNDHCTTEACVGNKCVWTKLNCSTAGFVANACVDVFCLPDKGCVNVSKLEKNPLMCDDNNNCTIDTCDPVVGCKHTPFNNCSDDNLCTRDLCDPLRGCVFVPIVCNNTDSNNRNDPNATCGVSYCEDGVCKIRAVECVGFLMPALIGAGLGTAALVGIVIAAVLFFGGLAGGGVYAAAQGAGSGAMSGLQNNPIYKEDKTQGMNPLYKAT